MVHRPSGAFRLRGWMFSRRKCGAIALVAAVCLVLGLLAPVAAAAPTLLGGGMPPVRMYGYAQGPAQHMGSAAGRPHYVPASATQAHPPSGSIKGHAAPKPLPALPPVGTRTLVHVGTVRMPPGHLVVGHQVTGAPGSPASSPSAPASSSSASASASGTPAASPSPSPSPSPSSSASPGSQASLTSLTRPDLSGGTDNASYSVASTFDTVPMADQSGRIAVTLTNTGTSTWTGYALGSQVFPAGDTTGTGTPLTTGANVGISATVAPNGTATVESVTPAENPGSYEICWDMVNASGTYFSAEGGNEYCAPYTIQQYPAQITEQEPLAGSDVDTQTPQLSASATVPGGYPANPAFTFAFQILDGPDPSTATVLQSSGWVSGNSSDWTPTTDLTWGTTYYWQVTVTDATPPPDLSSVTWTTPISFTVGNAQPGVSSQFGPSYQADDGNPVMTSVLGGSDYSGSGKTVDPRTGNISQQVTDANVATAGPALVITRTYNSQDPRTSQALGVGWSSLLDMSLAPDSDGSGALILTLPDGQQVRFAKNSAGGYAPPQDFYAVIAPASGGGFTVTDQTGTTYALTQASGSSWLISKITDAAGMAETLTYNSGTLTTITNLVSGRALHLTWATPSGAVHPHVSSIATDPVTAGNQSTALTWSYGYSGDLLTSVCPPGTTTACTKYGYITNGSHAPTAVLNTNPDAYYRLDDPAGAAAAANQVPVDDLTTLDPPATELGTTPGGAGPISGVSATSFDGSSSWIPLDGVWCDSPVAYTCSQIPDTGRVLNGNGSTTGNTTLNQIAISVWFKTTAPSGVVAGISGDVIGGPPCLQVDSNSQCIQEPDAVPLLWLNASGQLEGLDTISTTTVNTSEATAMTSPSAVDDGAWHQAVLIPGRALYLDGTQIATGSGQTLTLPAPANTVLGDVVALGAGLVPDCAGCNPPQWEYFNGTMADAAVWQNQVPGPDAVAAQYAAETTAAQGLTTITSPAGRTQLSATYDTVNDRTASLADASGGTWTYGSPVDTATAGAYNGAVMADAPEDFWPLDDTSGPTAENLVGSSATSAVPRPPATYSGVTLGQPGPMPDASAAGFSGASSQVSIPSQDFSNAGPVSAEAWFNTTAGGQQILLTGASGAVSGDPLVIELSGAAGTCLQAHLQDDPFHAAKQSTCGTSSNYVNDGAWHQAVATLSPASAPSGGKVTQTLTLYQDGQQVGSVQVSTSPTASSGTVTYIGPGSTVSLADVSVYPGQLTSAQVAAHYVALANQQGNVNPNGTGPLPQFNTQTITVTNPVGGSGKYVYASGSLIETISPTGGKTRYGYDAAMRASTITDPDGDTTYTTHDAHNNVTSATTCAATNNCQTVYTSYYEDLSNPLDPRNDKPTDNRDARSSSPYDPAYDTMTTYTSTAQIASQTTPPTSACPSGCKTAYAYTAGTEAAVGGGTEPAGLLASVTAPVGGVTSYAYDSAGDVMQVTDPLGLVTKYTYDNLGREAAENQVSDKYPNGLTTGYSYDGQDRVTQETAPPVTDRVTGAVHTKVTGYTYDPDGHVLTITISDATGGDPARTTTDAYDSHGNLASTTDALGNITSYTYDGLGDKLTETNPAGVTTAYAYDTAGNLLTTTLDGYTGNPSNPIPAENLVEESRAYDPAGRVASATDVRGTTTDYTYYGDNRLASSYVVCSSCTGGQEQVRTYAYDAAGNPVTQTAPGGLVTNTVYNADNQVTSQTIDPSGVDRVITASYDADGHTVAESLSGGGTTRTETMTYNAAGGELSQTVQDGSTNITTSYTRDQRNLVISETDPNGNTTTIANDEAGRAVVETQPAVPSQTGNGGAPVTANPVTTAGYNTFGDETEYSDPDGNLTKAAYNGDGQQTSVTDPSYTPPGASNPVNGTSTATYDRVGEETSVTDPLGNVTKYGYDQLGDLASRTDPGAGVWTYTYDPARDQTSVTDPTGAQTQATYESLGRMVTTTDLVRQNNSAAYTTSYGYDDAGNLISETSPTGVKITAGYDAVGEEISSTDGAGNTATYAYNLDGNLAKQTLPDGTAVAGTYDLAGRLTAVSDLNASGTALRTQSAVYDADGNATSVTDFRGDTTTATYDATGMLTSVTEPVSAIHSITVSGGYDLAGNLTATTDGNGNTTYTTYNSRGLPETTTEPSTAQWTGAANSQATDIYDGAGQLVTQDLPGGVQVINSYDANGNLTSQSGTGASAATTTRTFTYDGAGQILTAATSAAGTQGNPGYQPATSESFAYDDRGLLLSASGSAGTSSFTYNPAGQLASATDAAGTSTYTYDSAGRLATDAGAASGVTGSYSYNNLDQVTQISYGSGNDVQSFAYDGLHRLASDTVTTAAGATVASIGYGYDNNNNVTSVTTTGLAVPGGTGTMTNTYGYDEANRLTAWTATPSGGTATTTAYGYDNNGNLTSVNGVTRTYDARNELTSDGQGNSYSYSPNGDLASESTSTGTLTFTSDAYGQQVTDAGSSYTWDALGRVVTAAEHAGGSIALTYDGQTNEVSSDSSATYSRDPAGQITGVNTAAGGKTIALVDQHDNLSGTFTAAGTAMTGSTTWNPWGTALATTGPTIQVGYQGQWTDPGTGQTDMGARFYSPSADGFLNQDTAPGAAGPAASGLHAYVSDNPMTLTDPTGHHPSGSSGGTVTKADVNAAAARAAAAAQTAARLKAAAAQASAAAARAEAAAHSAAARARAANAEAFVLAVEASVAAVVAAVLYAAAQAELRVAQAFQAAANAAWAAFKHDAAVAAEHWYEPWVYGPAALAAGEELVTYWRDRSKASQAYSEYQYLMGQYFAAEIHALFLKILAAVAAVLALAAGIASEVAAAVARRAVAAARTLAAEAATAEKAAAAAEAEYQQLEREYQAEQRKARQTPHDVRQQGHNNKGRTHGGGSGCSVGSVSGLLNCAKKAVTSTVKSTVGSAVNCIEHPSVGSCASTVVTIVVAVGTDGTGEIAVDAAEQALVDTAEEGGSSVIDAAASCLGGESFTASTKVLLANGKAVPIASLKPGQKVLATNTRTGKTQPETIAAVLVHHDTNLYDLTIRAGGRTAVIDTTSNHLFWVPDAHRWVKAASLRYGTYLRTSALGTATVLGGWAPKSTTGWMWDLTVPGNDDHDFYIDTPAAAVLVHNTGPICELPPGEPTQLHHVLPQQFRAFFARAGLNVDDATIELPESIHGGLHDAGWNAVWRAWIFAHPNATAADIVAQASSMMRDYNLDQYVISVRPYR